MAPLIEKIPITAAVLHRNGLCIYLEEDRDDFWMNLGPCWGKFTNCDRRYNRPQNPNEVLFLLVEVLPVSEELPHPIVSSSNVLWRKREALEALQRESAYLEGFSDSAKYDSQVFALLPDEIEP